MRLKYCFSLLCLCAFSFAQQYEHSIYSSQDCTGPPLYLVYQLSAQCVPQSVIGKTLIPLIGAVNTGGSSLYFCSTSPLSDDMTEQCRDTSCSAGCQAQEIPPAFQSCRTYSTGSYNEMCTSVAPTPPFGAYVLSFFSDASCATPAVAYAYAKSYACIPVGYNGGSLSVATDSGARIRQCSDRLCSTDCVVSNLPLTNGCEALGSTGFYWMAGLNMPGSPPPSLPAATPTGTTRPSGSDSPSASTTLTANAPTPTSSTTASPTFVPGSPGASFSAFTNWPSESSTPSSQGVPSRSPLPAFCFLGVGNDFPGNDLNRGGVAASTPLACCQLCATRSDCVAWSLQTDINKCWLKSSVGYGTVSATDVTSGAGGCSCVTTPPTTDQFINSTTTYQYLGLTREQQLGLGLGIGLGGGLCCLLLLLLLCYLCWLRPQQQQTQAKKELLGKPSLWEEDYSYDSYYVGPTGAYFPSTRTSLESEYTMDSIDVTRGLR